VLSSLLRSPKQENLEHPLPKEVLPLVLHYPPAAVQKKSVEEDECRMQMLPTGLLSCEESMVFIVDLGVSRTLTFDQRDFVPRTLKLYTTSIKLKIDRRVGAGLVESEFD